MKYQHTHTFQYLPKFITIFSDIHKRNYLTKQLENTDRNDLHKIWYGEEVCITTKIVKKNN